MILGTTAILTAALLLAAIVPAEPLLLFDAGPAVSIGLPVVKVLMNLSSAVAIGGAVIAAVCLPPGSAAANRTLDLSSLAAACWAVLTSIGGYLTFLSVAGPVSTQMFVPGLVQFFTEIALGQSWAATFFGAAVISVLSLAVRSGVGVGLLAGLGVATLVPLALQGHAAGASGHIAATAALWLHTAGAATWIGGLVIAIRLLPTSDAPPQLLRRYSTIALACFALVAFSGVAGAIPRLTSPTDLFSTLYGRLLTAKVVALVLLAVIGAVYRARVIRRVEHSPQSTRSLLAGLVVGEIALMGFASGLAVVLARSTPPVPDVLAVSAAERFTGDPLPPQLAFDTLFTTWRLEPFAAVICLAGLALYGAGALVARRQSSGWSTGRTLSWCLGSIALLFATSGGPDVYGVFRFDANVAAFVLVALVAAPLLVAGRPIALLHAVRSPRTDQSWGSITWADNVTTSRYGMALTNPIVASALLAAVGVWAFADAEILRWTLENPVGRLLRFCLTLGAGILFAASQLRTSLAPRSLVQQRAASVLVAGVAVAGGVLLIARPDVALSEWFGVVSEGWPFEAAQQQVVAGVLLIVAGPLAGIGLAMGRAKRRRSETDPAPAADAPATRVPR